MISSCDQYSEQLSLMLDGQLSPEEATTLQHHLTQCEQCRRTAQALQYIHQHLRHSPLQHAPPGFVQRTVSAAVHRRQRDNLLFGGISLLVGTILVGGLVLATTFGVTSIATAVLGMPEIIAQSPDILGLLWGSLLAAGRTALTILLLLREFVAQPAIATLLLLAIVGGIGTVAYLLRNHRPAPTTVST